MTSTPAAAPLAAPLTRTAAPGPKSLGEAAVAILGAAAVRVVGKADAKPRPGQTMLIADMVAAMSDEGHGQVQAEAPTGAGKSLVYLSAAAAACAARGERSVISTESLALQAQIVDKDAPVVMEACAETTGVYPSVAVLKGWSNYSCTASTVDAANALLDDLGEKGETRLGPLAKKFAKVMKVKGDVLFGEKRERGSLVAWALEQALGADDDATTGDKNSYQGTLSEPMTWDSVSVSSADCLGAEKCPFADQCLPRAARTRAAEANIVVTNHHLLAVQAANDVPVVIGSKTLGEFHHVFVDEAHGLPQIVRNQGSVEVSARSVLAVSRAVGKVLDDHDRAVKSWMDDGAAVAKYVGDDLRERSAPITRGGRDKVVRLADGDDPLANSHQSVEAWVKRGADMVKKAGAATSSTAAEIGLRRARGRLDGLKTALDLVGEHKPGAARWVEIATPHTRATDQNPYPVVRYTPVDVAAMIRWSLWTREMTEDEKEAAGFIEGPATSYGENTAPDGPAPRVPLTSVVLSATMPNGFGYQVGLRAPLRKYPSPFDSAYGESVLFVPRAVDAADVAALGSDRYGKVKFDTAKHREWAIGHILDLVAANGGSALVLAATAASGREYAKALGDAAKGRWKVLSQWEGQALRKQVAAWKADESAVLVGTRSLMTGVDAAGDTCSLVIVDRPARAASNPVDDARVEALIANAEMDKWSADRFVYVADAGTLLEQAAGRLIRKVSDAGMVAVLDPRLLKKGPFSYPEPTRKAYLDTLHRFETKISVPSAAHEWLRERRSTR